MPHDCKGRLIEVGDMVKGRGYNVKHEIIGPVISVTPGAESCNISLAVVFVQRPLGDGLLSGSGTILTTNDGSKRGQVLVHAGCEYGQCDAFEIIQKHDGSMPK